MPSVKTGKRRDIMVILEFDLNDNKTKHSIMLSPTYAKRSQKRERDAGGAEKWSFCVLERE